MSKKTLFWLRQAWDLFIWVFIVVWSVAYFQGLFRGELLKFFGVIILVTAILFPFYQWHFKSNMKKRNVSFDTLLNLPKKERGKMARDILFHNSKGHDFLKDFLRKK